MPTYNSKGKRLLSPILHTTHPGIGSALIHTPFSAPSSFGISFVFTPSLSFTWDADPGCAKSDSSSGLISVLSSLDMNSLAALGASPAAEEAGNGDVAASSSKPGCGRNT